MLAKIPDVSVDLVALAFKSKIESSCLKINFLIANGGVASYKVGQKHMEPLQQDVASGPKQTDIQSSPKHYVNSI